MVHESKLAWPSKTIKKMIRSMRVWVFSIILKFYRIIFILS